MSQKTDKTYNLVYSVKGGCGKTTFSIWMEYYLNVLCNKGTKEGNNKSVLIDMDLLGTSMLAVFHGDAQPHGTLFTNDVFKGVKDAKKPFVSDVKLQTDEWMHVVFSSMDHSERNIFKTGRLTGHTPVVKQSIFRTGLGELIEHIRSEQNVKHFIFDMPPNSDGYADAVMECVFGAKRSILKRDDRANLFIIMGMDWGQTQATINELKTLLLDSDDKMPDRIFIVINHNLSGGFGQDCDNIRKETVEKEMKKWQMKENEQKNVYFLILANNPNFMQLNVGKEEGGIGLVNADYQTVRDVFPRAVIAQYAAFGESFRDVTHDSDGQEVLLRLISGGDADNAKKED